jgi:CBS domain-containing protein
MRVQDIMTRDVKSCGPHDDVAQVATLMWDNDCGIVPVIINGETPVGVITDRDICIAVGTRQRLASEIAANQVISTDLHMCSPDTRITNALALMREKKVRRLVVVDSNGILEGILSLNDIVLHCGPSNNKEPGFSYEDVIKTLQVICEHRKQRTASSAGAQA